VFLGFADGLSLKAAREAAYEHAVQNLSSIKVSLSETGDADSKPKGILFFSLF
jgi:hypothetical protein